MAEEQAIRTHKKCLQQLEDTTSDVNEEANKIEMQLIYEAIDEVEFQKEKKYQTMVETYEANINSNYS